MARDHFLPDKVQYSHNNDNDVLYLVLRSERRQVRNIVSDPGRWDIHPSSGSLADYAIGEATSLGGLWGCGFPMLSIGHYIAQIRIRSGDVPDCSDQILGASKGYWNGSSLNTVLASRKSEQVLVRPYDSETGRRKE